MADCESGGWGGGTGGKYTGDLGILTSNWYAYGGTSDISPLAQIDVAMRISGGWVPDQIRVRIVVTDGRTRCPECHHLTERDRTNPRRTIHWSTGLEACGAEVERAGGWRAA